MISDRITIPGTNVEVDLVHQTASNLMKPYIVSIYFAGTFYDYREFATEVEAQAFMTDPLASERPQPIPEPELDRSYIAKATRISTGRRVGRKPAAA